MSLSDWKKDFEEDIKKLDAFLNREESNDDSDSSLDDEIEEISRNSSDWRKAQEEDIKKLDAFLNRKESNDDSDSSLDDEIEEISRNSSDLRKAQEEDIKKLDAFLNREKSNDDSDSSLDDEIVETNRNSIKKRLKWTSDEDNKLLSLIEKYKTENFIPWSRIAKCFPNRNRLQIYYRYNLSLKPDIKKGKFSKEEDVLLLDLATKFNNFKKITAHFKGRTATQLRSHYRSLLNNGIVIQWTEEEDKKLIGFIKQNYKPNESISWSQLEKIFVKPFRNRISIRKRWNVIKKHLNSSFEGDLSKIPRPLRKRQSRREINQSHVVMTLLNNEDTKISDLCKQVSSTEFQRKLIDEYQNFFIKKYSKIRIDEPLEILEIDVVNTLFLINLLQGKICLETLYHKTYKKNCIEKTIVDHLRETIEKMGENPNETVVNYLKNTYLLPQSTENETIDQIIPSCFISMSQIDHMIAIIKPFLKFVLWNDSELDQFYYKPNIRLERNLKSDVFLNENSLVSVEKSIVSSAKSITCDNFLKCLTAKSYKSIQYRNTRIFQMRYLALFNFKSMDSIVSQIIQSPEFINTVNLTQKENKKPTELKTDI